MDFDLIVIGSGPGGYKAALNAAHLGARVALVEKARPGGTCLNSGCVPKKALLHIASLIDDISNLQGRGLTGHSFGDFQAAISHKNSVVEGIRANFPAWLKRLHVQIFEGCACARGRTADGRYGIEVEGTNERVLLEAPRVIIATGARPRPHPACPADGVHIIYSEDFMANVSALPRSTLFVGGGAIGVEFAFLFRQFGAEVTIVESATRLLDKPCVPEHASDALERKLMKLGVIIRKNTSVAACQQTSDSVQVTYADGSSGNYERVFVAIGRVPATSGLELERLGVTVNAQGFIETNQYLETMARGVYAVGDVKEGPMTANAALHDAKVAAANAVNGNHLQVNYNRVPMVIDSALEIAVIGLTEERADEAGFTAEVARSTFGSSAKARARNDYEGFIEVVHDGETGQLLGGCIVGPEAGEQIHMLAAACQSDRGLWFFADMNYTHPSWTEELENTIDPYTFAFTRSGKTVFRPGIYSGNFSGL
ncbi:MAG: dihydrolipoyl dehydrogenase family protein [Acidiferrobacteraceae bacterium]